MTYAELLASQGATTEDIATLNTPLAQRVFDAQQAQIAKAAADADARVADYKAKADDWYEKVAQPNLTRAQQDATKAAAEAARLRALVVSSTDESLRKVAEEMGYKPDGSAAAAAAAPKPGASDFDPNKYFTRDEIVSIAEREGDAIAVAQDIAFEHRQLFPDKPLNFRELRKEAVAARKPVEQLWQEKFGVTAAREARTKADREAHEAAIRKEEREKVTAELASQYANPNTVPAGTSNSPFVPRPKAGREKAPWDAGLDGDNGSGDRVAHAAKNWADRQAGTRTN